MYAGYMMYIYIYIYIIIMIRYEHCSCYRYRIPFLLLEGAFTSMLRVVATEFVSYCSKEPLLI